MNITFIDVGQGDATLVECPDNSMILIDLGTRGGMFPADKKLPVKFIGAKLEALNKYRYVGTHKVHTLDTLVITHPDDDHTNLVSSLTADGDTDPNGDPIGYELKTVMLGGKRTTASYDSISDWTRVAGNRGATFKNTPLGGFDLEAAPNATLTCGAAKVWVLSSDVGARFGTADKNDDSVVLMFEYGNQKAILTGDATDIVENQILDHYKSNLSFLKTTVLKLAHHGSAGSSTDAWIRAVQPWAVFASGEGQYGHPRCAVFDKIRTFDTEPDGGAFRLGKDNARTFPYKCGKYVAGAYKYDIRVEPWNFFTSTSTDDASAPLGHYYTFRFNSAGGVGVYSH